MVILGGMKSGLANKAHFTLIIVLERAQKISKSEIFLLEVDITDNCLIITL